MNATEWIVDRNGDGYADDVATRFVLNLAGGGASRDLCAGLINFAARLGLATHALTTPLVVAAGSATTGNRRDVPVASIDDLPALPALESSAGEPLGELGEPSGCLTDLFTTQGALADTDGDLLPDATRLAFDLPDELPAALAAAVANLAARVGLESGGVTLPLVRDDGARFAVRPGEGPARLGATGQGWLAGGEPAELARLL
ncbi:MAG TPA: hypothetical protein PKA95_10005, partial [Thermomicrobiales bacterium]|nr:hypothetical protein [Thermomicrobiales bacterium]